MNAINIKFDRALEASHKLLFYRNIIDDELIKIFIDILGLISNERAESLYMVEQYYKLQSKLLSLASCTNNVVGDLFQNYILDLILKSENQFTLRCEIANLNDTDSIPSTLINAAKNDLECLQEIFSINLGVLTETINKKFFLGISNFAVFLGSKETDINVNINYTPMSQIKKLLLNSKCWEEEIKDLASYYFNNGSGIFSEYKALRWRNEDGKGHLEGIVSPDPIELSSFIGYKLERFEIIQNTEQLLQGLPANNILLYGDRGTGKSSTVKAILNKYASQGLRLIEVSKHNLSDLPDILKILEGRGLKFIIFVDDLSFESDETNYRELKSILEGGIEVKPSNVLIYATSNRRHLIKEYFSDRSAGDEIGGFDTMQEKLSLADRFGIAVTFISPDQEKYLQIVEGIAKQRGIDIDFDILKKEALKWEILHSGRSPRTARQFIDNLEGSIKLKK